MLKRTLFFTNPAYLSSANHQLVVQSKQQGGDGSNKTVPIEDVGYIILENQQITLTNGLIAHLMQNNVVVIHCNDHHLPTAFTLSYTGHSEHTERMRAQLNATLPLQKQIWQQIVESKIRNQGLHLEGLGNEVAARKLLRYSNEVRSGDSNNLEATAASYYWQNFLPDHFQFYRRAKDSNGTNIRLNYGYAIIRAAMARALTGTGLLPSYGVHHRSKYNAFCLADDLMEPYRPYVDQLVRKMVIIGHAEEPTLDTNTKLELVNILTRDVSIDGTTSPMMNAIQRTATSLAQCFMGEKRRILTPEFA